jgi:hypothetical protein
MIAAMAMLFQVVYPRGEITMATGYPDGILVVQEVPPGPESCYLDELEVDFKTPPPSPLVVKRVVGGPRRPTHRVRLDVAEAEREVWMEAREAEGWVTMGAPGEPSVVWCVADRDGMDPAALERASTTPNGR